MNTKALLALDRWLGVPLCFAMTVFRKVFHAAELDTSRSPRTILLVKLAEQGSTVLAYAALARAVAAVGRDNVYFIAFGENRFILDILGVIPEGNILTLSAGNVRALFADALPVVWRLRKLRLDACIDMEFFSRGSAILCFLSGARRRAGFHSYFGEGPYRGDLMTHRLLYNPHLHTTQTFLTLVEAALGDHASLPTLAFRPPLETAEPPRFSPRAEEVEAMRALLRAETGTNPKLILLNANASDLLPLRRWASDRYVELARRILARYDDVYIAFTGAGGEAAKAEELKRQVDSSRCIVLARKTTMRQLLVLYGLSELLVTNDSGPAHFATLTPMRVITLFGPETPKLFAARSPRNCVLWAGLACSPCVNAYNNRQSPCKRNLCMESISTDEVFAAVCRIYEQNAGADKPHAPSEDVASHMPLPTLVLEGAPSGPG